MNDRPPHLGLRHLALSIRVFEETKHFYVDVLGFQIEWEPDADNVYLTSGSDNLALHRAPPARAIRETALDHVGILVQYAEHVDAWATYLQRRGVKLTSGPRTHRDGARSLCFLDPDGNQIQIIHHPPISDV